MESQPPPAETPPNAAPKTNAARRFLATYDLILGMPHQQPVSQGVAGWFDHAHAQPETLVAALRMAAVLKDFAHLERVLARQTHRPFADRALFVNALRQPLEEMANVLHSAAANFVPKFTAAYRVQLKSYADVLADDEPDLSSEDLAELEEAVRALREAIHAEGTPASVRAVLEEQLAALYEAIEAYHLRGPHAFVEVLLKAYYAGQRAAPLLERASPKQHELLHRAWALAGKAVRVLKEVDDVLGISERAQGVYKFLENALS